MRLFNMHYLYKADIARTYSMKIIIIRCLNPFKNQEWPKSIFSYIINKESKE